MPADTRGLWLFRGRVTRRVDNVHPTGFIRRHSFSSWEWRESRLKGKMCCSRSRIPQESTKSFSVERIGLRLTRRPRWNSTYDALVRVPSVWSDLFSRSDNYNFYITPPWPLWIVRVSNLPPTRETVQSRGGGKLIFMDFRGNRIKEKLSEVGGTLLWPRGFCVSVRPT